MSVKLKIGVIALTAWLAGCSEAMLNREGSGEAISPDQRVVAEAGAAMPMLKEVASGQPLLAAKTPPPAFEAVDADPKCRMPRPSSGAKLAYVYTYGGGVKTPLHYIADGTNAETIKARMAATKAVADEVSRSGSFEQAALAREFAGFARGNAVEWTTRIDVLVTDTSAPVYLVLTSYNSVMWNIQRAPGVQIDGIVVSAYEGGAIANGVDERRTGFMGFDGSPNRSCYLKGRGLSVPAEVRIASARRMNPDFDVSRYREEWQADERAGKEFFRLELPRRFGKAPDKVLVDAGGETFKAVLVGPVPDVPFEQQPVTRLQIPSYIAPYWGTRGGAFEYFGLES